MLEASLKVLDLEKMTFSSGPRMGTCARLGSCDMSECEDYGMSLPERPAPAPAGRNACAASLIDSQRLLVIGGSDGGSDLEQLSAHCTIPNCHRLRRSA